MTDRRLLLLHTGGTLGMRPTEWGWEPGADLAGWLSGLMTEQLPDLAWDLVSLEPLIDSSNARPAEWQRIVDSVRQHRGSHQAFVVLHGTDTLAFSAAATHLALAGTGLPVVFTSNFANLSLVHERLIEEVCGVLLLAVAVFGERPDAATLAGAALIVVSGGFAMWRELVRNRPR